MTDKKDYFVVVYITKNCNLNCKYCLQSYKESANMSFTTAKEIVQREMLKARSLNRKMELRLMGGEPFMNFGLIKELCEWIWSEYPSEHINVSIRTNGTLMSEDKKQWLSEHHSLLSCGPSIDGIKEVNKINRGINKDIKDFFMKYWPQYGAHGTLFPDSVEYLYDSFVYFNEVLHFPFDIKIGLGTKWNVNAATILEKQLKKLAHYLIEHPELEIPSVFIKDISQFGEEAINDPNFNCLGNQGGAVYDVDGKQYSCETLMPLVHGLKKSMEINSQEHLMREYAVDPECKECPALAICPTCPSMNIKYRGDSKKSATLTTTCKAFKVQLKMSAYLTLLKYEDCIKNGVEIPLSVINNLNAASEILSNILL